MVSRRRRRMFTAADSAAIWDRWQRGDGLKLIGRLFDRTSSAIFPLRPLVAARLEGNWSPEQIAGWWKEAPRWCAEMALWRAPARYAAQRRPHPDQCTRIIVQLPMCLCVNFECGRQSFDELPSMIPQVESTVWRRCLELALDFAC